ncbi:MAG TPA: hypothetical protein PK156_28970 [Polyangium sp.]|nr:hypothetical protein [Polyangium sp.]
MRRIDLSRTILFFWGDLVFHEAALLAEPEVQHLAPPVTHVLTQFESILKLDLDSRRDVLKTFARASIADKNLDGGIRDLHAATLFLVKQDRTRDEFKSLFSEHIGQVVRFALKRQVEVAEDLVQKLGMKLYGDEFKTPHTTALQSLIDVGKSALGAARNATLGRTEARLEIRAWKDNANAVRLANHGELLAWAAKKGYKKDWAEAFFLSSENAPEKEEEPSSDEPPAPP